MKHQDNTDQSTEGQPDQVALSSGPLPADATITITGLPIDMSPTHLARMGEFLGLEANGPDENPSPRAWMRAGISASQILRCAERGPIPLDLLVALLAGNCDPDHDDSTPQRSALIGGHASFESEWASGVLDSSVTREATP